MEKRNTYYAKDSLPRNRPSARLFRVMRDVLKKDLIQPPRYATSLFEQVQSILTIKDQIKKPMKSHEEAWLCHFLSKAERSMRQRLLRLVLRQPYVGWPPVARV